MWLRIHKAKIEASGSGRVSLGSVSGCLEWGKAGYKKVLTKLGGTPTGPA